MSVRSSELCPPPLPRKRVCLRSWTQKGGENIRYIGGEGVGGPNSEDWKESLALCILCAFYPRFLVSWASSSHDLLTSCPFVLQSSEFRILSLSTGSLIIFWTSKRIIFQSFYRYDFHKLLHYYRRKIILMKAMQNVGISKHMQQFFYLPEAQNPIPTGYTLYTCIQFIYSHREGGGGGGES